MKNSKIIDYYVCRRVTFFLKMPKPLPVTVVQSKSKEIKKFSMQNLNHIFGCNYILFASTVSNTRKYDMAHAVCLLNS